MSAARGAFHHVMTLRLTAQQLQQLKKAARSADMNLTVWMRGVLVEHAVKMNGQNGSSRLQAPVLPRGAAL